MGYPLIMTQKALFGTIFLTSAVLGLFAQAHPGLPSVPPISPAQVRSQFPTINLSAEEVQNLASYGAIVRFEDGPSTGDLNPVPSLVAEMSRVRGEIRPTVGIETLMIQALPPALARLSPEEQALAVYRILHGFQTMEGIEYWSTSRGRFRLFYETSHSYDPESPDTPLPDPQPTTIVDSKTLWVRQQDTSFGDNRYQVTMRALPSNSSGQRDFHLHMENLTSLKSGILSLAKPGEVHIDIVVRIQDGYVQFYGTTNLRVPRIFGLPDRARDSFYTRILALYSWFTHRILT